MPYPGHTTEEIARRGREVYEREIRSEVGPEHRGRFLILGAKSGDYEIADDGLDASERLLERRPDALLYGLRIGAAAAYHIGGRLGPTHAVGHVEIIGTVADGGKQIRARSLRAGG